MNFLAELLAKIGLGLAVIGLKRLEDGERVALHELSPRGALRRADRYSDAAGRLRNYAYRGRLAGGRQSPDRGE